MPSCRWPRRGSRSTPRSEGSARRSNCWPTRRRRGRPMRAAPPAAPRTVAAARLARSERWCSSWKARFDAGSFVAGAVAELDQLVERFMRGPQGVRLHVLGFFEQLAERSRICASCDLLIGWIVRGSEPGSVPDAERPRLRGDLKTRQLCHRGVEEVQVRLTGEPINSTIDAGGHCAAGVTLEEVRDQEPDLLLRHDAGADGAPQMLRARSESGAAPSGSLPGVSSLPTRRSRCAHPPAS